ncbi:acyl-CoA/acyl-ACP dehydrogenase [Nocardioides carbamazepini]|uniref:acyl-CoA dehydrogenase family protein n=1 Tax=Nocardioides carbamazepini TaxID=2854259 RepID=UPI00214A6468|nr:acyl-CoA dehydrogenase family protein [Nocardioides carbamazepini]MCR1781288.1 acyl-CoA/acyl-ACP dehydrogenase [Nocardioides carbamazepini]
MDFTLSREQAALRDAVRELYRRSYDIERLRETATADRGWRADVWRSLADTGILGLAIPEDLGGAGAGIVEVATVMTELGRVLAPEPVLDSALIPADLLLRSNNPRQWQETLEGIASGELLGAIAHEEWGDRWPHRAIATSATETIDGWILSGSKRLVKHGDVADFYLVSARAGDDVAVFMVDGSTQGLSRTAFRTPDRRRGAHLLLEKSPATLIELGDPDAALRRVETLEQVALCAEAIGSMEEALRITTDYLGSRKQFGAALVTYQALAHRLADLHVLVEMARSMSLYAVAVVEDGAGETRIASRAALQVCRSARAVGHESIHLHGGIGVTEEYVIGQYAARLMAIEARLGGALEHLQQLASGIDSYDKVALG